MNNDFNKEFIQIRNSVLLDVVKNKNSWDNFLTYWSNLFENYSVDSILNFYFYKSTGTIFFTFEITNIEEKFAKNNSLKSLMQI